MHIKMFLELILNQLIAKQNKWKSSLCCLLSIIFFLTGKYRDSAAIVFLQPGVYVLIHKAHNSINSYICIKKKKNETKQLSYEVKCINQ